MHCFVPQMGPQKTCLCPMNYRTSLPCIIWQRSYTMGWEWCLHVTVLICTISCSLACNIIEPGMCRTLQQTDPQPRPAPWWRVVKHSKHMYVCSGLCVCVVLNTSCALNCISTYVRMLWRRHCCVLRHAFYIAPGMGDCMRLCVLSCTYTCFGCTISC